MSTPPAPSPPTMMPCAVCGDPTRITVLHTRGDGVALHMIAATVDCDAHGATVWTPARRPARVERSADPLPSSGPLFGEPT